MNWRILMDQKDLLLIKARSVLESTRSALEKILEDDDDVVLSAKVIGEINGDEVMQTTETQPEQTTIQKARAYVFARASELSHKITPEQAERFYDDRLWSPFPAVNHERIFEFFRDSRYEYPERPTNPRNLTVSASYSADTRIRLEAVLEIICMFEELHRIDPSNDITALMKKSRQRYDQMLAKSETPEQTARRHAFEGLAELTGKPQKQIAKVYDSIDWKDPVRWNEQSRTGRYAVVYKFLFDDLPEDLLYKRDPKTDAEREQRRAHSAYVLAARQQARDLVHPVIRTFENLRAELATMRRLEGAKAARKAQLAQQIERSKAEYERLSAA